MDGGEEEVEERWGVVSGKTVKQEKKPIRRDE